MKLLLGIILGIVLVVGAIWYFADQRKDPRAQQMQQSIASGATQMKDSIHSKLDSMDLQTIKEELARTGKVVRQKAGEAGNAIADATADARVTAAIKAKLVADHDLSALSISVNTTAGRVTLSGTVSSAENIQKAISLAMATDGVKEVVSTLQVKNA
jgi:osmotically-inducible protein OsmY